MLFATHSTYRHYRDSEEIVRMAAEDTAIFGHLLAGTRAARAREVHFKRSVEHDIEVLK